MKNSPAIYTMLIGSLLVSLSRADVDYTSSTTLTTDTSLGNISINNSARLTIQSGTITTGGAMIPSAIFGSGSLHMNGGTLNAANRIYTLGGIGFSNGEFLLRGGVANIGGFDVGTLGASRLLVEGGTLNSTVINVGSSGSVATARFTGGTVNNSGNLRIGIDGNGSMLINSGNVTTGNLSMGHDGRQGTFLHQGGNFTTGNFYFGNSVNSTVNYQGSNCSLTAATTHVGYQGASGLISLYPGCVFSTGKALLYSITAGFHFFGGTLQATQNQADWLEGFVAGSLVLQAAGGTIDTQAFNVGISGPVTGSGVLTKTGFGTLTVSAACAHTGGTVVSQGTIMLSGSGSLGPAGVTVYPAGVLKTGTGSFHVPVIAGNGSVQPGSGGTLIIGAADGNSNFPGSILGAGAIDKAGTGVLTITGAMTHTGGTHVTGGTLNVSGGGFINHPTASIVVASTGTGALNVDGSSVTADTIIIGHDGGTASVSVNNGSVTTNEIARWSLPSGITFNGATLRAAGNTGALLNGFTNGSAVIQNGGLTVDTNGFAVATPAELTGGGGFVKAGAGTLTLNGAYAFTGSTSVMEGTLSLTSARLSDSGTVAIAAGAVMHLDYAGTDMIGALIIGGVTQSAGTWGAIGSGAQHETAAITGTGRLVILDELSLWLAANGFPAGTASGDEDHDGLTNLDEYYSGSLPGQSNASTTTAALAPGVIEVIFDRRKGLQTVSAAVEWSADLSSWSSTGVSAPQVIADQGSTERLRVTVPRPETAARRYVRVRPVQN